MNTRLLARAVGLTLFLGAIPASAQQMSEQQLVKSLQQATSDVVGKADMSAVDTTPAPSSQASRAIRSHFAEKRDAGRILAK